MKLTISVFIIALNEVDRIDKPIKSVIDWVDEVIVIDSGSTDGTQALAEKLGAKVIFNKWQGYGPQKVFGEKQCRNKWLLNIDADEEISKELAAEIKSIFTPSLDNTCHPERSEGSKTKENLRYAQNETLSNTPPPSNIGFRLKILALYPHQKKLPFFAAGTTQVRLYHKDYGGFKNSPIHDSVVLNGSEKMLKGAVIHRSHRSHSHTVGKINSYTTLQAEDLFKKGKNPSALKIIFTPLLAFIKCYFFKKYMFYGLDGFIHACIYAFGRTLRLAKAREKFNDVSTS
jgi:glycosyltransferase involved in cell wall biosynthesis